ncbi:unnamed protein product [Miscanthus lutarioriparius]|uniref:Telomeric single stranded DNA binding POT1/Cdc13 domain-containing protein n=1 Tax=Miscanthus lutarioriparius TaxID=422564 RepID=A0A811MYR1_9POAL|nr:unnamed protein product [Miscanthus lutarioriparius]
MEEASARERKRPREGDASEGDARMREVWKRLLEAASGKPRYTYLPIADTLKVPGVRVCLFAVVAEIGAAVHSRGTDFTVTLRIVDESRKAGISATFFADNTALLPCVKSSGDVISLHDVVIQHHGEFCVTFNKKFSSFALFESKVSAECSPYQTSMKCHGRKHDKELLTQMRTWLPNNPLGLSIKYYTCKRVFIGPGSATLLASKSLAFGKAFSCTLVEFAFYLMKMVALLII